MLYIIIIMWGTQANGNQGSSLMRQNHILNSKFETLHDIYNLGPIKLVFTIDGSVVLRLMDD